MPILAEELASRLEAELRVPVKLTVTRTSSTVLRKIPKERVVHARVHEIFLSAPEPVMHAVVAWFRRPRRSESATINRYVRSRGEDLQRCVRPRRSALRTRGEHRDLQATFDRFNREHFAGAIGAAITFGRIPVGRRRRRSIQYGVFDSTHNVIRIHPLLDEVWIPDVFVELIVFHEMLHAAMPPKRDAGGRCRHHTAEFRAAERRFAGYRTAVTWEKANLDRLLRSAGKLGKKEAPRLLPFFRQLGLPF